MSIKAALLAVAFATMAIAAQLRPDFSGDWSLAKSRSTQTIESQRVTSVVGLLGEKFIAKQDAKTLTLDITSAAVGRPVRAVYNLDNSESKNVNPGQAGQPDEAIISRASWDGEKLVILTRGTVLVDGKPRESKRVIWIDADGLLTIERSSEGVPTTRSVYERPR
jgi:hypothetical protein